MPSCCKFVLAEPPHHPLEKMGGHNSTRKNSRFAYEFRINTNKSSSHLQLTLCSPDGPSRATSRPRPSTSEAVDSVASMCYSCAMTTAALHNAEFGTPELRAASWLDTHIAAVAFMRPDRINAACASAAFGCLLFMSSCCVGRVLKISPCTRPFMKRRMFCF